MVRSLVTALLGLAICFSPGAAGAKRSTPPSAAIRLFASESAAIRGCRGDEVVWLNTQTGIYHERGMRWYGRTKQGAFVCRRVADAAGDRDTRNGQ
jgi:hypothetical protein